MVCIWCSLLWLFSLRKSWTRVKSRAAFPENIHPPTFWTSGQDIWVTVLLPCPLLPKSKGLSIKTTVADRNNVQYSTICIQICTGFIIQLWIQRYTPRWGTLPHFQMPVMELEECRLQLIYLFNFFPLHGPLFSLNANSTFNHCLIIVCTLFCRTHESFCQRFIFAIFSDVSIKDVWLILAVYMCNVNVRCGVGTRGYKLV